MYIQLISIIIKQSLKINYYVEFNIIDPDLIFINDYILFNPGGICKVIYIKKIQTYKKKYMYIFIGSNKNNIKYCFTLIYIFK
jgi:hypothetical protein